MAKKKVSAKAGKRAAKKPRRKASRKAAKSPFKRFRYDDASETYASSCRLAGREVDVYLDMSDGTSDVADSKRIAEDLLHDWPKLHEELCRIAREEIASSKGLSSKSVPPLKLSDVKPFALTIFAESEGETWWSFGLDVRCSHLDEDEYVDVSRAVDGSWTTSEVSSTE